MTMAYQYTQTNRLEEPHSYMYTQFEGEALLSSFNVARMASIRTLSAMPFSAATTEITFYNQVAAFLGKFFDSIGAGDRFRQVLSVSTHASGRTTDHSVDDSTIEELSGQLSNFDLTEPVATQDLLHAIIAAQLVGVPDTRIKLWTDRLVQRFEVTKKLYATYLPGFRKGDGTNSAVQLYWLFALALSLNYVSTRQVKYLSTLLKVCDLLCSLPENLHVGQLSPDLMQAILATELVSIELLVEKKGIDVAFT